MNGVRRDAVSFYYRASRPFAHADDVLGSCVLVFFAFHRVGDHPMTDEAILRKTVIFEILRQRCVDVVARHVFGWWREEREMTQKFGVVWQKFCLGLQLMQEYPAVLKTAVLSVAKLPPSIPRHLEALKAARIKAPARVQKTGLLGGLEKIEWRSAPTVRRGSVTDARQDAHGVNRLSDAEDPNNRRSQRSAQLSTLYSDITLR